MKKLEFKDIEIDVLEYLANQVIDNLVGDSDERGTLYQGNISITVDDAYYNALIDAHKKLQEVEQ